MNQNSELEKISMQIITWAGMAKSFALEAINKAEEGEPYQDIIDAASENLKKANEIHFQAIQLDSKNDGGIKINVLFLHAEDQMMSAETIIILAKKMVKIYEKIK